MKTFLKILLSLLLIIFLIGIGFYILLPLFNIENSVVSENILFKKKDEEIKDKQKESDKFSFVVLSDSNGGGGSINQPLAFQNIIQEIASSEDKPDFVIHNGDMIAGTSATSSTLALQMWDEFKKVAVNPLHENNIGFFPSPGNHDASFNSTLPQAYEEFWGNYENIKDFEVEGNYSKYYSFSYHNSYFIILSGAKINIDPEQLTWLENDVNKTSEYNNVFVFSHIPLIAASNYHPNDKLSPNDKIKDILKGNIKAFFGAHHNVFYDVELDGIRQIGVGRAGSGGAYQLISELGGGSQDYLSYIKVEVEEDNFEIEQIIKK